MNSFSILLVDNQTLFREGLSLILKRLFPSVILHEANTERDALNFLEVEPVNLVLLGICYPSKNGMDAAEYILQTTNSRVLMITSFQGEGMIRHILKRKVHGLIFKNTTPAEFKEAIEALREGKTYLPESIQMILDNPTTKDSPSVALNRREAEILYLLKTGYSSRKVAETLNLKENTVKSYRDELLQKTRTKNVAQLISFAYENGILN